MLSTEDAAKTKWCPFARSAIPTDCGLESGSYNRDPYHHGWAPDGCRCIASACMAWRIEAMAGTIFRMEKSEAEALISRYPDAYEPSDIATGLGSVVMVRRLADIGFCGLAGKP